ncbi:MAG TPA: Spo0E family sporulation regulatory protein-aspartic acid phosphatase [Candidatus Cottocaccamicrobium excrementipullorum]|nr:Spo0E family sporulation regulatory protein-aspartic acid phosphatase [Candidatus Cottocaccamicrobium excrementipullorum]
MNVSKNELIEKIETARVRLNASIDAGEDYEEIYRRSVELDGLIEQYIVSGF